MRLNVNCTGILGDIGIFYPVVFRAVINCILYLRFAALKKAINKTEKPFSLQDDSKTDKTGMNYIDIKQDFYAFT